MLSAPSLPKNALWLNTSMPLSLDELKGHVVLLDFWTYCCINCIHILPDLKRIEKRFKDQPVVVIGIHAAKFLNEQNPENIQSAIDRYEIEHPVLVDNDHQVWDSYAVRAWPTFVLIDTQGKIRGEASGEGHEIALTKAIEALLKEGEEQGTLAKNPVELDHPAPKSRSTLSFPGKIAFNDSDKLLAISDSNHNRILITELTSPTEAKIIHTIGTGKVGHTDGDFQQASFNHPQGLAFYKDRLLVCDTDNHLLRTIHLKQGRVSTWAGTGEQAEYGAQGGPALSAALSSPWDITIHEAYAYLAMAGNHQVWRYSFEELTVEVFAGNGYENIVDGPRLQAQLAQPSGITHNQQNLYWADSETSSIRALDWKSGEVRTVVGHGLFIFGLNDGPTDDALLQHCLGLTAVEDQLYVADTYNHALRQIDVQKKQVTTLLKRENKESCMIGDKSCAVLPLAEPNDVKKKGELLYIADTNNHLIRILNLQTQELGDLKISG